MKAQRHRGSQRPSPQALGCFQGAGRCQHPFSLLTRWVLLLETAIPSSCVRNLHIRAPLLTLTKGKQIYYYFFCKCFCWLRDPLVLQRQAKIRSHPAVPMSEVRWGSRAGRKQEVRQRGAVEGSPPITHTAPAHGSLVTRPSATSPEQCPWHLRAWALGWKTALGDRNLSELPSTNVSLARWSFSPVVRTCSFRHVLLPPQKALLCKRGQGKIFPTKSPGTHTETLRTCGPRSQPLFITKELSGKPPGYR